MKARIMISLLALLAIFALILTNKVWAEEAKKVTILTDFGCGMLDGNGGFAMVSGQNRAMSITTRDGKSMLTCRGNVAPNFSMKKPAVYNFANTGIECFTLFGVTREWQEVVSPSGEAILQCRIK